MRTRRAVKGSGIAILVPFESLGTSFLFAFHNKNMAVSFSRFDTIHERDSQFVLMYDDN